VKPHFTGTHSSRASSHDEATDRFTIVDPSFATPQTARVDPVLGFLRQACFAPRQVATVLTS
jgi:hypothetical protein